MVGNEREMLLGIPSIENGTAETITSEIVRMIKEKNITLHKIAELVFDTTCVNSGLQGGIVKRLQGAVGKPLLQLACRHHISEIWGGAACNIIYGSTVSPAESRFKALANKWNELNLADYRLPDISDRYLKGKIGEVLGFLNTFLASDTVLRDDYRQLAELSFLLLGGNGGVINMHAPGASHHARWMSSMIYTMKITLFRHQLVLVFQEKVLDMIQELAIYLGQVLANLYASCRCTKI